MKKETLVYAFMILLLLSIPSLAKPNVHIIATGGGIAGSVKSTLESTLSTSQLTADGMISLIPDLKVIANLSSSQLYNKPSQQFLPENWVEVAKEVKKAVSKPDIDAVIITHGTDTMEETAYFVHLTVQSPKPIVFVGATRPYNHLGTDMKSNLLDAVIVAANKKSKKKGVLLVLNGKIYCARDAEKLKTTGPDTFEGHAKGLLGYVYSKDEVEFYYSSTKKHTLNSLFNIDTIDTLPRVDIVTTFLGDKMISLPLLVKDGAQGFVVVGFGNGNFPTSGLEAIREQSDAGIPIVRTSRSSLGLITKYGEVDDISYKTVRANNLSPQKARILLMLSMLQSKDRKKLQEKFDAY